MTLLCLSVRGRAGRAARANGYNVAGRAGVEFYTPERLDRRRAGGRGADRRSSSTPCPPPAGEMPVVLAAGSSGILLHEAIGHGMEADFNRKGISIYSDKIGKPIAKPFVNIVDDGTLATAPAAPSTSTTRGTPAGTTHARRGRRPRHLPPRLHLGRHYGVEPTGNGRRESYRTRRMPRMRSTYMLPGPHQQGGDHRAR